jgi:hypothetical protein
MSIYQFPGPDAYKWASCFQNCDPKNCSTCMPDENTSCGMDLIDSGNSSSCIPSEFIKTCCKQKPDIKTESTSDPTRKISNTSYTKATPFFESTTGYLTITGIITAVIIAVLALIIYKLRLQ